MYKDPFRLVLLLPLGMLAFLCLGIGLGYFVAPEYAHEADWTALPFGIAAVGGCIAVIWPWLKD